MENPYELIMKRIDDLESAILEATRKEPEPVVSHGNQRLTREEITDMYKISKPTIHKLMNTGKLDFEKIGRKTLFRLEEVERVFRNNNRG